LIKIKSLNIENNNLHNLQAISHLKNLQILSAGKNNLGVVAQPPLTTKQSNSSNISTTNVKLPMLPSSLKQIKLDNNHLDSIPKQIMSSSLTKLIKLDLSHNNIASLPSLISTLSSLTELNLSHNLIPR